MDRLFSRLASLGGILLENRRKVERYGRHRPGLTLSFLILSASISHFQSPGLGFGVFLVAVSLFCGSFPVRILGGFLVYALFWASLLWRFPARLPAAQELEQAQGPEVAMEVIVLSFPVRAADGGLVFPIEEKGSGRRKWRTHLKALGETEAPFPAWGETWRIRGRIRFPPPPTNPGQFDYPRYLRSQDLEGLFEATAGHRLSPAPPPFRLVQRLRTRFEEALAGIIPAGELQMLRAALLGATDLLEPQLLQAFRDSGMLHILAISGQHVSLIALLLLQIFSFLRLPRKAAFLASAVLLGFYLPVTGAPISVTRSVLLFFLLLPAVLFERPGGTLYGLVLAGGLCLLVQPYQVLSLGFHLTFAATAVLLVFSPLLQRTAPAGRDGAGGGGFIASALAALRTSLALSLFVTLATWPFLAATTHSLSPLSVVGNLLTVPLSSGLLAAGILGVPAALIGLPVLPNLFGAAAALFARALGLAVEWLSGLPGSLVSAPSLSPLFLAVLGLFFVLLPSALRRRRGKTLFLLGACIFIAGWAYGAIRDLVVRPVAVTFLDVGQGDAALVKLPGRLLLVDAGPGSGETGSGSRIILPALRAGGHQRIDQVLLTHPDLDHFGGLESLVGRFPIGEVLYGEEDSASLAFRRLRRKLALHGIPFRRVGCGDLLYRFGTIRLDLLHPCDEDFAALGPRGKNERSLVVRLSAQGRVLLLAGDLGAPGEERLLSRSGIRSLAAGPTRASLSADLLKVGHHGSNGSSSAAFLKAVGPRYGLLSCGRRNAYRHPGREALGRLQAEGIALFSTARDGAVRVRMKRQGLRFDRFLDSGAEGNPARAPGPRLLRQTRAGEPF